MLVAEARGLTPSQWDDLDPLDKAEMIALFRVKQMMTSEDLRRMTHGNDQRQGIQIPY